MKQERRRKLIFTILLIAQAIYLVFALMIPPLPGWKMFSDVDYVSAVHLYQQNGVEVSLRNYLPKTVYDLGEKNALEVAAFICKKENQIPEWTLTIEKEAYALSQNECIPRKK